uniref:FprA family A-type flavoprotein n=1 Tax=candidate division WOR-3 bacterium TaxID=2052148 RepID=A0A7C4CAC9_UNCW3
MPRPFEAVRITDRVWWVGAIDWSLRDFHGYSTPKGTTYNAYLVVGEYPILIDTVKAPFRDEMLARIASVVDPQNVRVVVSHHAEMDHSGCLPEVIELVRPERVLASRMGDKNLHEQFHGLCKVEVVKDAETVKLGGLSFTFLETPMLHWPDSMVSYLAEEKLVFSQDGFGMHLAGTRMFADECDRSVLEREARKYYANILLPYSGLVTKLLERVEGLRIPIELIAPDHGPVWRGSDTATIMGWWHRWAEQRPENRAVIVYDTMWQSTALMARAIADGLRAGGTEPSMVPLCCSSRADAMTELLCAGALLVGTPTINNGMFPTIADFLTYARGLKPKHLVGAAFGSYGWSGEGTTQVEEYLTQLGVELLGPALKLRFVPDEAGLIRCRELGRQVAERLLVGSQHA